MSKQRLWHPLFTRLLRLLIEDYYKVDPEVPVGDLPRRGDLLIVRRLGRATPPFVGLWSHLTDWNVVEFKGPTDDPEEADLDLLMHVGTGLTCRINEERKADRESVVPNHLVSFWYLAPKLGETFLGHAQSRVPLTYETGGLWRGRCWGHPVWFVSYTDTVVEEDTIPLRLLDLKTPPRAVTELLQSKEDLARRFQSWIAELHPRYWKEVGPMSYTKTGIIDWEGLGEITDLCDALQHIPPEKIIQRLGTDQAIRIIGTKRVMETLGVGEVLADIPTEQLEQELQRRQRKP